MSSTFKPFKRAIKGHLLQFGAVYLTHLTFLDIYKKPGKDCLKCKKYGKMYKILYTQAVYDKTYFYGIMLTVTINMQQEVLLKFEQSHDRILAWDQDFEYDGSKELRLKQLETMANKPYSSAEAGEMFNPISVSFALESFALLLIFFDTSSQLSFENVKCLAHWAWHFSCFKAKIANCVKSMSKNV